MNWYDYKVGVPFGNANYDTGLGGSHDMTFLTPPNILITQIADGIVTDISAPSWGKQVCIKLDKPINGHDYFGILHLSAVNPALKPGDRMKIGDLVGWSGGCNTDEEYKGTSNPTGQNFCNTYNMSSQPQVGIALHDGPAYGGLGWKVFPPIDTSLNPMPVIVQMQETRVVPAIPVDTGKLKQAYLCWHANDKYLMALHGAIPVDAGPEYNLWHEAYMNDVWLGYPTVPGPAWCNWGNKDGTVFFFQNGRIENIGGTCIAYENFTKVYPK